ncbi:hypothetical protein [Bradyrhizobium sp. SZCCHNRI3037]|uniref:hypothetical protein n=1 Tax=Bradyrhizobium sp. SZCCHNRI3037 TaxID=3057290 RepID=UPI002916D849|nr:hypothetical protein [Bradyrhizobium sp. SZCCHNRI3037]
MATKVNASGAVGPPITSVGTSSRVADGRLALSAVRVIDTDETRARVGCGCQTSRGSDTGSGSEKLIKPGPPSVKPVTLTCQLVGPLTPNEIGTLVRAAGPASSGGRISVGEGLPSPAHNTPSSVPAAAFTVAAMLRGRVVSSGFFQTTVMATLWAATISRPGRVGLSARAAVPSAPIASRRKPRNAEPAASSLTGGGSSGPGAGGSGIWTQPRSSAMNA